MELLADVTLGRPLPTSNDEYQPLEMQVTNLHEEMSKERQCEGYPTSSPYADAGSVVLLGMSHVQSHPCGCRGDRFEQRRSIFQSCQQTDWLAVPLGLQ